MARSGQHSVTSWDGSAPTGLPDTSRLVTSARDYSGLLQPSSPFGAFQVFPTHKLYMFPVLSDCEDCSPQEFINSERIDLKGSLQGLQNDSPFKRGAAEAFPDDPNPQSHAQSPGNNSVNSQSQALEDSVSVYEDPLHMSRDLFRDSLPRYSETSEQPSRNSISINTREALHRIQRDFAARQNDLHLHSITPESSFFKESRTSSVESIEFNPSGRESIAPRFEMEESFASIKPGEILTSAGDESFLELELRPSLYRRSRTSDIFAESEESSMDEGTAFRPPVFHTGPTFSRTGTQMPEIQEEDSSSNLTPHSHLLSDRQPSPFPDHTTSSSDKSTGRRPLPTPVFIPEKVLQGSMTPTSFATFAEGVLLPSREAYSPVVSKVAVFLRKQEQGCELLAAWPISGFHGAAVLEYSNVARKSKGHLPSKIEELPPAFSLLPASALTSLLAQDIMWLTCGFEHMAALTSFGKVFTWGYGASGALGHGDTNSVPNPKPISTLEDVTIIHIESGGFHTAAVSSSGELWTWGRGDMFQLGHSKSLMFKDDMGSVVLRPMPVAYFTSNRITVKGVSCGEAHTVALDSEGHLYAFGWGAYGQLGLGAWDAKQKRAEKVRKIKGLADVKVMSIACGLLFSACVTEMGQVWVWGCNDSGQLGLGSTPKQALTPTCLESLLSENVIDIVCGESHTMALTRSGGVYGWGKGLAGVFRSPSDVPASFAQGSEIVCFAPQSISHLDNISRFLVTSKPKPARDSLATALMARLEAMKIDRSLDSSVSQG